MDGVPSTSERNKGRRYGFSCLTCRRRKIKCDGKKPACINCSKSKETCVYKESSVIVGNLSERLRHSQARVLELEHHIKELAVADSESRDIRLAALVSDIDKAQGVSSPESPGVFRSQEPPTSDFVRYDGGAEFSVDEDGKVRLSVLFWIFTDSAISNNTLVLLQDFIQSQSKVIRRERTLRQTDWKPLK
jgi:hypothetical protein